MDISLAEERSQIEDDQQRGAKALSDPGSKAATGSRVNSLSSDVIRLTHTQRDIGTRRKKTNAYGALEKNSDS